MILVPKKYLDMPTIALTDLSLRALKSDGAQLDYWDSKTPAFGVRIGRVRKSFIAKVNNRRITLGTYPELSLADARRRALGLKSDKRAGTTRRVKFTEALQNFYELHIPTLKPSTQRQIRRILDRHFLPAFKTKTLDKISHQDISSITDALAKRAPSEAWHAFKDARTFFKWCVPRYVPHSPMEGLNSPTRYIPRKRVLSFDEIRVVWAGAGVVGYPFGTMLKLLLLTGQRWGEIASLRRSFIDRRKRTITLPETKNGEQHTFPYGQMVADILDTIPLWNSTDLLFPGRDGKTPWNGSGKAKWLFNKQYKIAHWQILDLRRTFGTKLAELAVPPHIVERLLNHKLGSLQTDGVITAVAAVYNRALYMNEMRDAVTRWERQLRPLVNRLKRAA